MNGKMIISLLAGIAIGVAGGILGTRSHYKSKYEKQLKEALDEAEEMSSAMYPYARSSREENAQNESVDLKEQKEQQKEYMKEEVPERVDYHKIYQVDEDGHNESQEEAEIRLHNEYHQKNRDRAPIIISAEAAGDLPVGYREEPLYLFMGCGTVTDDFDNVVEDPELLLGDCLTKYGFSDEDNDEDMIFVQNFALDIVYTVQKVEGCFQDESM